jgi:hypothetical protein
MIRALAILTCAALCGCATFQGGMPDLPFSIEDDLGYAKERLKADASVKTYYDKPSEESRNKYITARLVIINVEYLKFIKTMSAEEEQIHSATDILRLSMDAAASVFNPASTKTILSSLSAVTGGARLSIDKNAYYEKTMSALISSMNAQRKDVLLRIVKGMGLDLNGYPITQAMADMDDYILAGTLPGAIAAIQKDAGAKESDANAKINKVTFMRAANFVDPVLQARIDAVLGAVDKLADASLFSLNKSPPVADTEVDKVVALRDPSGKRFTDKATAASILKMRIVLSKRDPYALTKWEAAVKSEEKK